MNRPSFFLTLSLMGLSTGCVEKVQARSPSPPVTGDVTAMSYVMPPLPKGSVILSDAFGGSHRVEIEIAADAASRQRGMMWRKQLAAGHGMLFVFDYDDDHSFWMKNTLIALDMLFISAEGKVVGIVENAAPQTLTPRSVGKPARYVLEVPGGWTAKVGIRPGASAKLNLAR